MEHEEAITLLRDPTIEVRISLAYGALEVSVGNEYFDNTSFYECSLAMLADIRGRYWVFDLAA